MNQSPYLDIARIAAPEIIVLISALLVLTIDLFVTREESPALRKGISSMFAVAGLAVAGVWMFAFPLTASVGSGMLVMNPLTGIVKASILSLAILTLIFETTRKPDTNAELHVGERTGLILLSTIGMTLLVSSRDLLMVFLCLELSTIPLYVLAAFEKHRKDSVECGLKFFLFGAVSTALTLFGFSLLYGMGGSTNLGALARTFAHSTADPLLIAAIVMFIAGIGFKVAAAPFHMWAPDVYQAAPVSSSAFIASASKIAGFFVLGVVLILGLGTSGQGERIPGTAWLIAISVIAVLSMVLGNLAAIVQTNVRRLLAFSAVAHAGYMLLAFFSASQHSFSALVFYAVTYALSTFGAFAVVGSVPCNGSPSISDFAGLVRHSPMISVCMLIFMLSLAGIPPMAGFMGKFLVFVTLMEPGPEVTWRIFLLMLALGTSAVSLYYYLKVLKSIFVSAGVDSAPALTLSLSAKWLLAVVAATVLALGCFPGLLLKPLSIAVAGH